MSYHEAFQSHLATREQYTLESARTDNKKIDNLYSLKIQNPLDRL